MNQELAKDIFNEFELSNEEMSFIRGGEGGPIIPPPEKI